MEYAFLGNRAQNEEEVAIKGRVGVAATHSLGGTWQAVSLTQTRRYSPFWHLKSEREQLFVEMAMPGKV